MPLADLRNSRQASADLNKTGRLPIRIGFCLVPGFSLITLASGIEPFRMGNERSGKEVFAYRTIGVQGREVTTNDGIQMIADEEMGALDLDIVILVASLDACEFQDRRLATWLRQLDREGTILAPVGAGTVIAARLGLLDGYECVTHWRLYSDFLERFPRVRLGRGVYTVDRRRITGAGGASTLDLALRIATDFVEPRIAAEIAEIAMVSKIRSGTETQRMSVRWRYDIADDRVADVVEIMEANLETPLTIDDLCERVGVSSRQIERLFNRELGQTPKSQYLKLRLQRAHQLLVETSDPILQVAIKTGFYDAAHFSRNFFRLFGVNPADVRHARENRTRGG